MNAVHEHEVKLNRIMTDGVKDLNGLSIIGPEDPSQRGGICSLLMDELRPRCGAPLGRSSRVMVRSGQHCVHSWFADRVIQKVHFVPHLPLQQRRRRSSLC